MNGLLNLSVHCCRYYNPLAFMCQLYVLLLIFCQHFLYWIRFHRGLGVPHLLEAGPPMMVRNLGFKIFNALLEFENFWDECNPAPPHCSFENMNTAQAIIGATLILLRVICSFIVGFLYNRECVSLFN